MSGTKYLNILIGAVDSPSRTYMLDCQPLPSSPDSMMIIRAVDDAASSLTTERNKFRLLLFDAAPYMTLAVKTIKVLYPQLFHITCIANLLHNCALKIKVHYDIVDQLIARLKALVVKNKSCQAKFDAIGQPPQPVVTRWASWINAALYYVSNLPTVRDIVRSFEDGGLLLSRAKDIVDHPNLCRSLLAIASATRPWQHWW